MFRGRRSRARADGPIAPPAPPRLRLRRFREDDLDLLCALDADEGVLDYIDRTPPTRDQQATILAHVLAAYDLWPDHGRWAAESPEGDFVGWFSLWVREDPQRPDLGYRLHRRAWGHGLATEGARALVDHAFATLGAEAVVADTMAVNAASRRVLEKCGLRHVDTVHLDFTDPLPGAEHGDVLYEITRQQWQARRR